MPLIIRTFAVRTTAVAACLALVVQTMPSSPTAPAGEPLLGLAAEQELDRLISGQAEAEALLQAALEGPERTGSTAGS